ncbi:UDP-N-acetylmuramoyl-tripeptide--D-alanyl-D-alanine ligase [Tamlana fucoidanivorans]|uniref:UDP-N-acetylmuramoyl-tripeptide--D-alanyl-D-alanine ligase n=1 Tax=Allotamlana fucoidanivorans TaxID=2583814 RepID=A0A5C4SL17_9FLAO|nr:UDP-N-acetylmuramoyl-tripeptide--D-alanyl-D-alanine ligase [Tamlana fucoidanivorans]TNJ43817.1 UDP-N-acetylmuramoyl-tripeptide--D-alanyl-D-alanine ligase [Tamlana fucoidanivorans]
MNIQQLHRLFLTSHGACTDTRKIKQNAMFFALKGENFNGNSYAEQALKSGARYAVVDEDAYNLSENTILVEDVLETLQQLASFHRNFLKVPIIALTGSNGKTTTKELINTVLSQKFKTTATIGNLNNHIGVPLTLLSMNADTEIGIVEMGANHLKEIAFLCNIAQPDYGYITNFGKAHLEGFGGVEGVIKGKSEMYDYLIKNNKTIFVNGTDPIQLEKTLNTNRFVFNAHDSDVSIKFVSAQPFVTCQYKSLPIESHLIGDYNYNNIAAAIAIGHYFKVDAIHIKSAIEAYTPTNNRSQIINQGNIKIILDAYNANPTSMRAALHNLKNLKGEKIAILGDMFELGNDAKTEHQNMVDLAISLNIDQIIFVGENFLETNLNSSKAFKFKSFEDFKMAFNLSEIKNKTLLIKGSRGMALERILELL